MAELVARVDAVCLAEGGIEDSEDHRASLGGLGTDSNWDDLRSVTAATTYGYVPEALAWRSESGRPIVVTSAGEVDVP